MDKSKLIELENLIFKTKQRPAAAANMMADIIGVLIGLKPVMVGDLNLEELAVFEWEKFIKIIEELNLKVLFFKHSFLGVNGIKWSRAVYISSNYELAAKANDASQELWSTMDDYGQIFDIKGWTDATRKIGKLLGYPETATDYFISHRDISDENRQQILKRNRYYLHSAEHEEEEYQNYDLKLNRAVAEFAPKTAEIFRNDSTRRWL